MKNKNQDNEILKSVKTSKIIFPIIIGFLVVFYMLYNEFSENPKFLENIGSFKLHFYSLFFIFLALIMMFIRDAGYIFRIKILSGDEFSWRQSTRIILLWEFASAVTPSAVGGTGVAILFLTKEGLKAGKSSAIVMATSFLDELYFILMFPILLFIVGQTELFSIGDEKFLENGFENKYFYFAVIGYSIKTIFTLIISYGLFFNPRALKWFLLQIFRFSFLRKWRQSVNNISSDLIFASNELKSKKFSFWIKAFFATFLSWSARYWVVNFLLLALIFGINNENLHFDILKFSEHILIFARQLVMWIMMLVMPTPGGSGFVEAVFSEYMAEFIPIGFIVVMALVWRLLTYYPYLLIGAFLLPKWIKEKFKK